MKKALFVFSLLTLIYFQIERLHAQGKAGSVQPGDTFRIQNYPLKIWHGDSRVRNLKFAEPIILTKNDALIAQNWKSSKVLRGVGLGVQAGGVIMMGVGFAKTLKADSEGSSSMLLGGVMVELGGLTLQLIGTAKAKKALRRYNAIHSGRLEAMQNVYRETIMQPEDNNIAAPEAKHEPARAPEIREVPTTPKPRFVNETPRRKPAFFENNDSLSNLKPALRDPGFGLKTNGLKGMVWENSFDSLTLQFRQFHSPNTAFRLDVSLLFQHQKDSGKDAFSNGGYSLDEFISSRFVIGLAPGIEKHFPGTRRLDPYVGIALPLALVGKLRRTTIDDNVNADGSYIKRETKRTDPGGFGIGLDGFAGLNYYIAKNLAIGIEYNLGISLLRLGGKSTFKRTDKIKPANGPETTTTTENPADEVRFNNTFIGNRGVAGLNLIYYLGKY